MDIVQYMRALGQQARCAASEISRCTTKQKNNALLAIATAVSDHRQAILKANAQDIKLATAKVDAAMLDRLRITGNTIDAMLASLQQVALLPDPVGNIDNLSMQASGIVLGKMRVPLGVIGMIYESRPNVTLEAASLCLKSGNAVILRGGSEALHSNLAIYAAIQQGLQASEMCTDIVQLVSTTDRAAVGQLLTMEEYIDVIIPRGGKSLIKRISQEARVPVIKHLDGICHVYIDQNADLQQAHTIAINSKTHRYGVCNAMETLLLHKQVAADVLPQLVSDYLAKEVELRVCSNSRALLNNDQRLKLASEADWSTEYLAPILSIKLVDGLEDAIAHINTYGSGHTDSIVTKDIAASQQFLREVDSSSVMLNTSTRFADGFEYGLGAEIGISTDKMHVRGPVGLTGLTSEKYIVTSDGAVRS
jgi:glutamate-5-semialdehyde dehydrogenase